MKKAVFTLIAIMSTSCMTMSSKARSLVEADDKMVENCKFIGSARGWTGWGSAGISNARVDTLDRAAEMGATHYVWAPDTTSVGVAYANAKCYICNGDRKDEKR